MSKAGERMIQAAGEALAYAKADVAVRHAQRAVLDAAKRWYADMYARDTDNALCDALDALRAAEAKLEEVGRG